MLYLLGFLQLYRQSLSLGLGCLPSPPAKFLIGRELEKLLVTISGSQDLG